MLAMALMGAGLSSVDFLNGNMLPITLKHFLKDPFYLSCLLAVNHLGSFLVQPYVAWRSDRTFTRFGRRRPFLLIGMPITAIAVLMMGLLPALFPGEARQAIFALAIVVLVNVLFQVFLDVYWGIEYPLYADSFEQQRLGRAVSFRVAGKELTSIFMYAMVIGLADRNECFPYLVSVAMVMGSLFIVVFIIQENMEKRPVSEERYRPVENIATLAANADYRKVALAATAGMMMLASRDLFISLFATETLGMSKEQFGTAMKWGPLMALVMVLPGGFAVDWIGARYGVKYIMAFGFLLSTLCMAFTLFFVSGPLTLRIANIFWYVSLACHSLSIIPMIFQFVPAAERGRVFGLIQFTRASAGFITALLVGQLVKQFADYRASFALSMVIALLGMIAALMTRRVKYAGGAHQREEEG